MKFSQTEKTKGVVEITENGKKVGEIVTMGDLIIAEGKKNKKKSEKAKYMENLFG